MSNNDSKKKTGIRDDIFTNLLILIRNCAVDNFKIEGHNLKTSRFSEMR